MKILPRYFLFLIFTLACFAEQTEGAKPLYLDDSKLAKIEKMGLELLASGFNAGNIYDEVWIRDFNTFITHSCEVQPVDIVRDRLLMFYRIQEADGNIADGYKALGTTPLLDGYHKLRTDLNIAYYKNTVETDQEASLIQATYKFVKKTRDSEILKTIVDGVTVIDRMEHALDFLMNERFDEEHGLLWGGTTADWGDVQPEHEWGVELDESSNPAIDIYDNAMFVIAINDFLELNNDSKANKRWSKIRSQIVKSTRKHLWDSKAKKFRPHLYLFDSPFPADFNESEIFFHGGTAVAIEAGMLKPKEIISSYQTMQDNVSKSGAQSIGLTLYPVYPEGFFKNPHMSPYHYQNGGDWTWFGARMASQLARNGFIKEAREAATPMLKRVIENDGFYEWYTKDGDPQGYGTFRGSAGVVLTLIDDLRAAID
ncbi:hypothetical protein MLD52_20065 [Puniceicoccaceae bacterium K14]|nr:hypothetical protein [Puniceicoccaceae bacterium K14]